MHTELVDALSTWRARQPHYNGVDLVLTSRVGTPIRQENLRRSIREACHRAGIEVVTPYELRHTAITHQVEAAHAVTVIADWAGTSEKMIFEHYRHRMTDVVQLRAPDF